MLAPPPAYQPVVIVGAGRSGTNMLRDTLVKLPGFATWKCDEINPVWRHGHFFRADDELVPSDLSESGRRTIRKAFERVVRESPGASFIVEKTCANSLRLPYVDAALDDAKFIQIVRDGRDVVPSAVRRWRGELEVEARDYFLAKARYAPKSDLPLYAASFAKSRLRKLLGFSERLDLWGPRYRGMDADMQRPVEEICALQWVACVERSDEYLETLAADRWLRLYYEEFVADPTQGVRHILSFLGREAAADEMLGAVGDIRKGSVGKGLTSLALADPERLDKILRPTLLRHGYRENVS